MKVFVLGGTGSIGASLVDELVAHGHEVSGLARSERSASVLGAKGVEPVMGDLRNPGDWADVVTRVDAVIQAAGTFSDDEGDVLHALSDALIDAAARRDVPLRFVDTGGCWLYGETGDAVADETSPFNAPKSFAWCLDVINKVMGADVLAASIVHPAMVYSRDGGVFSRFIEPAKAGQPVEIWGSPDTRWPVVHRGDTASAYRLVMEQGKAGAHYNIATEHGVRVGDIADAVAHRFGISAPHVVRDRASLVAEHGEWAEGPTIDQQMSGDRLRKELGWHPEITNAVKLVG